MLQVVPGDYNTLQSLGKPLTPKTPNQVLRHGNVLEVVPTTTIDWNAAHKQSVPERIGEIRYPPVVMPPIPTMPLTVPVPVPLPMVLPSVSTATAVVPNVVSPMPLNIPITSPHIVSTPPKPKPPPGKFIHSEKIK